MDGHYHYTAVRGVGGGRALVGATLWCVGGSYLVSAGWARPLHCGEKERGGEGAGPAAAWQQILGGGQPRGTQRPSFRPTCPSHLPPPPPRPCSPQEEPFATRYPLSCGNQAGVLHWIESMLTHLAPAGMQVDISRGGMYVDIDLASLDLECMFI